MSTLVEPVVKYEGCIVPATAETVTVASEAIITDGRFFGPLDELTDDELFQAVIRSPTFVDWE